MNQKNAKRLRKIAMGMVVSAEQTKPDVKIDRVGYSQDSKTGQIRVKQNTWKGAYKALKVAFKKGTLPKNVRPATTADWNASASSVTAQ